MSTWISIKVEQDIIVVGYAKNNYKIENDLGSYIGVKVAKAYFEQ